MSTCYIRTKDIFNIEDECKRKSYFDVCRNKALKCGLVCQCHIDGMNTTLFMVGPKSKFIKYYLSTLLKTSDKVSGIKRLIDIIFT